MLIEISKKKKKKKKGHQFLIIKWQSIQQFVNLPLDEDWDVLHFQTWWYYWIIIEYIVMILKINCFLIANFLTETRDISKNEPHRWLHYKSEFSFEMNSFNHLNVSGLKCRMRSAFKQYATKCVELQVPF